MSRLQKTATTSRSKKKPIPKNIRDRAMANFQKLRRLEEANNEGYVSCISCGVRIPWQEAQGGHYIPRANRATEIEHDNVWPQCQRCNGFLNGNPIPYRRNLVKRIGEARVKRIEDMAMAYKGDEEALASLSPEDIESVRQTKGKVYYAEKNKEFKERLNGF